MELAALFDLWRVWPRLMSLFIGGMWIEFNTFFFSVPINQLSEFALVQYGVIIGVFIGFCKFYMDTGGSRNAD
jgi:hypothetical protein